MASNSTITTTTLLVFPFMSFGNPGEGFPGKSSHLHKKAKPWRTLVVVVKWHHLANDLLTGHFHDKKIELTKITRENAWEEKAFETA